MVLKIYLGPLTKVELYLSYRGGLSALCRSISKPPSFGAFTGLCTVALYPHPSGPWQGCAALDYIIRNGFLPIEIISNECAARRISVGFESMRSEMTAFDRFVWRARCWEQEKRPGATSMPHRRGVIRRLPRLSKTAATATVLHHTNISNSITRINGNGAYNTFWLVLCQFTKLCRCSSE